MYTVINADTVWRQALPPEPTNLFLCHEGSTCGLNVDFIRLAYDHERLAAEMASEGLPEEFIETIRTGCSNI